MLAFLFTLLVITALCISYYFTNKMSNQRKQILLLKYQNNNLKKITKVEQTKTTTIEYIFPNYTEGKTTKKCDLFLSPLSNSPILNLLKENTLVQVHDSAKINNEMWYEISIMSDERINSKGWIREDSLNLFEQTNE